jgi:DNA repair exonuclease SbcCD ATPase subunit
MNNFSIAQSATSTAISSVGSSMKEQEKFSNSLEARINRLDTAWNKFTLSVGNAVLTDSLIGGIESLNDLATGAAKVIDKVGVLGGVFGILGVATFGLSTKFRIFSTSLIFGTAEMSRMQLASAGLSTGMTRLGIATIGTKAALRGLATATLVGGAFIVFGIIVEKLINSFAEAKKAQEEFDKTQQKGIDALSKNGQETEHLIDQYNGLTEAKKKAGEDWSVKQEEQYLSVQSKLAAIYPQLISYIDSAGQSHLKSKDQIQQEVDLTNELIAAKKEEMQLDAQSKFKKETKSRDSLADKIDTKQAQYIQGVITGADPRSLVKLKTEILNLQKQWSDSTQKITSDVLKLSDSYTTLKVDPSIKKSVDDFLSSLDTKNLNANELEKYSKQVAKVTDSLQGAYKSGDKVGFDNAKSSLIELAQKMGATKLQAYGLSLSFDDIKKASEAGASAIFAGKDGMDGLDESAGDLTGTMDGLSGAIDGTTGAMDTNANAASILFGVTSDQISQAENAIAVIQMLSGMENLSAQQKFALANATGILAGMYPQLNGQISENIGWISSQVGMMSSLSDVSGVNASTMIANQNSTTKATIAQINQRIAGYQKEAQALGSLVNNIEAAYEMEGMSGAKTHAYNGAQKKLAVLTTQMASAQSSRIEAYYGSGVKTGQVKPYTGSPEEASQKASKDAKKDKSSSSKAEVDHLKSINDKLSDTEHHYKLIDGQMNGYTSQLEKQNELSKEYRVNLQNQIILLNQKKKFAEQDVANITKELSANKKLTGEEKKTLQDKLVDAKKTLLDFSDSIADYTTKKTESSIQSVLKKYQDLSDSNDYGLSLEQAKGSKLETGSKAYSSNLKNQSVYIQQKIKDANNEKAAIDNLLKTEKLDATQKEELRKRYRDLNVQVVSLTNDLTDNKNALEDAIASNLEDQRTKYFDGLQKDFDTQKKLIQNQIDEASTYYDPLIEAQQQRLDLLDDQIEKEDRLKQIKDSNDEINKVKNDKRFIYIDALGNETLTYDKGKVDELQKTQDEMLKQFERDDIKKSIQDEIDRLNKAKDDKIKILNTQLDAIQKNYDDQVEAETTKWDDLIKSAQNGTLTFDTLMTGWYGTSLDSLGKYGIEVAKQIENIKSLFAAMGDLTVPDASMPSVPSGSSGNGSSSSGTTKTFASPEEERAFRASHPNDPYTVAKDTRQINYLDNKGVSNWTDADKLDYEKLIERQKKHDGGIVGATKGSKLGELVNKLFNLKPGETAVKSLVGELQIPPKNFANGISNIQNMINSIIPNQLQVQSAGNTIYQFQNVTVQADNVQEFIKSIDFHRRSNQG